MGKTKLIVRQISSNRIGRLKEIEFPENMSDCIEIDLKVMTKEELEMYREHKRKRNKRVYRKFGVDYEL